MKKILIIIITVLVFISGCKDGSLNINKDTAYTVKKQNGFTDKLEDVIVVYGFISIDNEKVAKEIASYMTKRDGATYVAVPVR